MSIRTIGGSVNWKNPSENCYLLTKIIAMVEGGQQVIEETRCEDGKEEEILGQLNGKERVTDLEGQIGMEAVDTIETEIEIVMKETTTMEVIEAADEDTGVEVEVEREIRIEIVEKSLERTKTEEIEIEMKGTTTEVIDSIIIVIIIVGVTVSRRRPEEEILKRKIMEMVIIGVTMELRGWTQNRKVREWCACLVKSEGL